MDNIAAYMNDYHLYGYYQHGLCKHRGCVTQLLHVAEDVSEEDV